MKITEIKQLYFNEVKVIRFHRFKDHRGYFTETFRKSNFNEIEFLKGINFYQSNESFSHKNTIRGLHFQWNPYMGKLVRVIRGQMIDLILDIRKGSPTFGKIIGYDMKSDSNMEYNEWIWVPPGFAHGNLFVKETIIEYYCSGEYNPGCEASISPLSRDIDWSECQALIRKKFEKTINGNFFISDKDKNGMSLKEWEASENSSNFIYGKI